MRSLQVRLPLVATIVLAASLTAAALIAHELVLVTGRNRLDNALTTEHRRALQVMERIAEPADGRRPGPAAILRAAEQQLRNEAGSETVMVVLRARGHTITTDGSSHLVRLRDRGRIPQPATERIETLPSDLGDVRSLAGTIPIGGRDAVLQAAGSLRDVQTEAWRALTRIAFTSAIGLVIGAALVALVIHRALRPLKHLASTARTSVLEDLSGRVPEPERPDEIGMLAREFNTMLERLEQAAEGERTFMATVSHELRTPITIARGHLEVLLGSPAPPDPEATAETVRLVREELFRMQRLVEDLLVLGRVGWTDFVTPAPVGLRALFEDLELRLIGLGTRRVALEPAPDVTVRADADRLMQALLNLIVNADSHTPEGTRVSVGARVENGDAALWVADDGPGIDPAVQARMFEPFVKGTTRPGERSTGLGLAVVHAIVDAHRGRIDVATGPQGTTVTIRLPGARLTALEQPRTGARGR